MSSKRDLLIPPIRKVATILADLDFLQHIQNSSAGKNLAYQIQYLEFMSGFYNNYKLYGSVESIFLKDYMLHIASAVEALLFAAANELRMNAGVPRLTDSSLGKLAKVCAKYYLINSATKSLVDNLRIRRKKIHAGAQKLSDIKLFTIVELMADYKAFMSVLGGIQRRIINPGSIPECLFCENFRDLDARHCRFCLRSLDWTKF